MTVSSEHIKYPLSPRPDLRGKTDTFGFPALNVRLNRARVPDIPALRCYKILARSRFP